MGFAQGGDGLGEHEAEAVGGGVDAVVLEDVDGGAHAVLVEPEVDGADKRGRGQTAGAALAGLDAEGVERIAAAGAGGAGLEGNFSPADGADWRRGELRQGGAAKGAKSGEKGAAKGVQRTSEHAGHSAPPGSLRWWNVERQ